MAPVDPKNKSEDFINDLLRLGFECNERCVFCNFIPETEPNAKRRSESDARDFIDRLALTPGSQLSISGGEPTLRKELPALIRHAKAKGIGRVQIQTNATLIDPELARTLKEAGLTEAFVAFHSHVPEIQDELTGLPGSFAKTVAGIRNCLAAGLETAVNTVITTKNHRDFAGFVDFVQENFKGISHLSLAIVQPHGKARDRLDLLPKYSEIADELRAGLARAKELGLTVDNHYCSLPLCYWAPEDVADTLEFKESTYLRLHCGDGGVDGRIAMVIRDKTQGEPCACCWLKNFCFGVWKEYVDHHGFGDIAPSAFSLKFWD